MYPGLMLARPQCSSNPQFLFSLFRQWWDWLDHGLKTALLISVNIHHQKNQKIRRYFMLSIGILPLAVPTRLRGTRAILGNPDTTDLTPTTLDHIISVISHLIPPVLMERRGFEPLMVGL